MNDVQRIPGRYRDCLRRPTRALSIVVSSVFLLILFLAVFNEDRPHGAAIPVLVLLVLTMVAAVAAWRWEKVGGGVVVLLALGLSAAAYSSSRASGLGPQSWVPALIYGVPFLVVGILFWISGRREPSGSHHDLAALPPMRRRSWLIGAVLATIVVLTVIILALVTGARVGG